MSLDAASEIWREIKPLINSVDRNEAAEIVVNVLVEHDYNADDIRSAFKGDSDIKRALADYIDHNADVEEEDDDDYDDFDDDDDEDDDDY